MLLIRPFQAADGKAVEELKQRSGFEYDSPEWGKMLVSGVVEEDGQLTMAAFLRKTAETYFVIDPEHGRKRGQIGQLLALHREMIEPARRADLEDVHCWMPPEIAENFGKMLLNFGWVKPLWPCFSYRLPGKGK